VLQPDVVEAFQLRAFLIKHLRGGRVFSTLKPGWCIAQPDADASHLEFALWFHASAFSSRAQIIQANI